MSNYQLGSFPRFGHQERWAAERRERAIANSVATRRCQKICRQKDEFRRIQFLLALWSWLHDQIDGKPSTPEMANLAFTTAKKIYRRADKWNVERYYRKELDGLVATSFQIVTAFGLAADLERCMPAIIAHIKREFPCL